MYEKIVLLVLVTQQAFMVHSENNDECDLNLAQIFRTPKDFSQVNFDHFEILERNNFGDNIRESPDYTTPESCTKKETRPKSVANAQVMLRFGGDDIRGQNYVGINRKVHRCHHRHRFAGVPKNLDYPPYPPPDFPIYPIIGSQCLPMIPPPAPQYYYPYPPPPPYAFPDYYYRSNPLIDYRQFNNQRFIDDSSLEGPAPNERDFLELREGRIENGDHPKILKTEDLSEDEIQKARCTENAKAVNAEENQKMENEDGSVVRHDPSSIVEKVANFGPTNKPSLDVSKVIVLSNVEENNVPPTSKLNVIKYVDINLSDFKKKSDTASANLETWLNNSIVPYACASCKMNPKLLVSYPISSDPDEKKPDLIQDSDSSDKCNCQQQKGFCSCCSCERDPSIPLGKRFPADIDSLHQVKPAGAKSKVSTSVKLPIRHINSFPNLISDSIYPPHYKMRPPTIGFSSGGTSSKHSSYSSDYSQISNDKPKIHFSGYRISSNSGYFADPSTEVHYQEPARFEMVETSNVDQPHIIHTKIETPHIFKVVPKYDIVVPKIVNFEVPDLVPTDRFVCPICRHCHHINTANYCPNHPSDFAYRNFGEERIQRYKRALECNCQRNERNYNRRYGNRSSGSCKCRQMRRGHRGV